LRPFQHSQAPSPAGRSAIGAAKLRSGENRILSDCTAFCMRWPSSQEIPKQWRSSWPGLYGVLCERKKRGSNHLLHLREIQPGMENPHPQTIYTSCVTSPELRTLTSPFPIESVAFSADGWLVSASKEDNASSYGMRMLETWAPSSVVTRRAWGPLLSAPPANGLQTTSVDTTVKLWRTQN